MTLLVTILLFDQLMKTDNLKFYQTLLQMEEYAQNNLMDIPDLIDFFATAPTHQLANVIQTLSPSKARRNASNISHTNNSNTSIPATNTSNNQATVTNAKSTSTPNFDNMKNKELSDYIATLMEANPRITLKLLLLKYKKYISTMTRPELIAVIKDIQNNRI